MSRERCICGASIGNDGTQFHCKKCALSILITQSNGKYMVERYLHSLKDESVLKEPIRMEG
uniref:Uncharacterized protein n=1 Tax=viral metagenome TaxID=1070528 RepID=A0A6M3K2Y2_9ZZZZ